MRPAQLPGSPPRPDAPTAQAVEPALRQSPPPSGEQVELRHGDQRAIVVEVGGGLRTYAHGERDVLDGYAEQEMSTAGRGQVLIPWPNRLRDGAYEWEGERHQLPLTEPEHGNAIHGLVRFANWTVALREPARVRMEHVLHPQPGYPFTLALALEYTLETGGLTVRMRATNIGSRPCPFGAGAHPYLTAGASTIDSCTLRAPGARFLLTDERAIPTGSAHVHGTDCDFTAGKPIGSTRLDTAFTELARDADGLARVELASDDGGRVTFWQDERYPYLMLFSGDTVSQQERRRRSLAVEPMTCAPNALRSGDGLLLLAPGETFSGAWGVVAS
jgi:aldose 1-epimerase